MKATDFDFPLPYSLIALKPIIPRDECRLLVLHRDGTIEHRRFRDIGEYLNKGDLLLLNNTRVFPARLIGTKQTGGRIEVLLVREIEPGTWEVMSRERYTGKIGFRPEPLAPFTVEGEIFDGRIIKFNGSSIMDALWKIGQMPLPPYIKRRPQEADKEWYQTVYAEKAGSIAAPTAGLHFTEGLIAELRQKGINIGFVTLHIGTGTFKPVRVKDVEDHAMDEEYFEIDKTLIETIRKAKESGKRVVSVGTTTTRAIEGFFSGKYRNSDTENSPRHSVAASQHQMKNQKNGYVHGHTDIFIYPGYKFRMVDSILTNFHLPRSTPLMLTSALSGIRNLLRAYNCAISMGYRFFSYGDAMLIL